MRYDADIYNIHDIDPSETYTEKMKPDEKNSSYHPDTDGGRTDGRTGWIQYNIWSVVFAMTAKFMLRIRFQIH